MNHYKIHDRKNDRVFFVKADTIEDAAKKGVKMVNGTKSPLVFAHRVTGDKGLSGFFQGYKSSDNSSSRSFGPPFHVSVNV